MTSVNSAEMTGVTMEARRERAKAAQEPGSRSRLEEQASEFSVGIARQFTALLDEMYSWLVESGGENAARYEQLRAEMRARRQEFEDRCARGELHRG